MYIRQGVEGLAEDSVSVDAVERMAGGSADGLVQVGGLAEASINGNGGASSPDALTLRHDVLSAWAHVERVMRRGGARGDRLRHLACTFTPAGALPFTPGGASSTPHRGAEDRPPAGSARAAARRDAAGTPPTGIAAAAGAAPTGIAADRCASDFFWSKAAEAIARAGCAACVEEAIGLWRAEEACRGGTGKGTLRPQYRNSPTPLHAPAEARGHTSPHRVGWGDAWAGGCDAPPIADAASATLPTAVLRRLGEVWEAPIPSALVRILSVAHCTTGGQVHTASTTGEQAHPAHSTTCEQAHPAHFTTCEQAHPAHSTTCEQAHPAHSTTCEQAESAHSTTCEHEHTGCLYGEAVLAQLSRLKHGYLVRSSGSGVWTPSVVEYLQGYLQQP
jgi:hypothetical protein